MPLRPSLYATSLRGSLRLVVKLSLRSDNRACCAIGVGLRGHSTTSAGAVEGEECSAITSAAARKLAQHQDDCGWKGPRASQCSRSRALGHGTDEQGYGLTKLSPSSGQCLSDQWLCLFLAACAQICHSHPGMWLNVCMSPVFVRLSAHVNLTTSYLNCFGLDREKTGNKGNVRPGLFSHAISTIRVRPCTLATF